MKIHRLFAKPVKLLLPGLFVLGLTLPAVPADDPGGGNPPGGGGSVQSPGEEVTGLPILADEGQPHTSFTGTPDDVLSLLGGMTGKGRVTFEFRGERMRATLYGNLTVRLDRALAAQSSAQIRIGTRSSSSRVPVAALSSRLGMRWDFEMASGTVHETRYFAATGLRQIVLGQRTPQQTN